MKLVPIPIRPQRRRLAAPTSEFVRNEHLFSSLVMAPGVMAALSTAAILQHFLPRFHHHGFPLAGLVGLLLGWSLAYLGARRIAVRLDPARVGQVIFAMIAFSVVCATPAAFFAQSIGWDLGAVRLFLVATVLGLGGLIWGGYIDCDALASQWNERLR